MTSLLKNSELTLEKADKIVSETLNSCDDGELYVEDTKSETIVLDDNKIKNSNENMIIDNSNNLNSEKNKLVPTQIGSIVNEFLMTNFKEIMDFNFTVTIENELDNIAQGTKNWIDVVKMFYNMFNPKVLSLTDNQILEKNKYI